MPGDRLANQYYFPGWWVAAYEAGTTRQSELPLSRISRFGGLSPSFHPSALNVLAVILHNFQCQLLGGRVGSVSAIPAELSQAGDSSLRRKVLEELIQALPALRIMVPNRDQSGVDAYRIFHNDAWMGGQGGDDVIVELSLTDCGTELILGLYDAYGDLIKSAQGSQEARVPLGGRGPLGIWRSIWLELEELPQALFSRLERAVQWDFNCVQIDGVFGLAIKDLFHGLSLPAPKGQSGRHTTFAQRLRLLAKLGQRLKDQGFMAQVKDLDSMALRSDQQETLVWKVSPQRLLERQLLTYRQDVSQYFLKTQLQPNLALLTKIFCGPAGLGFHLPKAQAMLGEISSIALTEDDTRVFRFGESCVVAPAVHYTELSLRASRDVSFPLPPEIRDSDFVRQLLRAEGGYQASFERFREFVRNNPETYKDWCLRPYFSLASTATSSQAEFREYIASFRAPLASLSLRRPDGTQGATSHAAGAGRPERAGLEAIAESFEPPTPAPVVEPAAARTEPISAAQIRQLALQELLQLRDRDPTTYLSLKRSYLESLDPDSRKVIRDFETRMNAKTFDEHLKQRLVRYMVDNPSLWKSRGSSNALHRFAQIRPS